jgi:hypothetical protein
LKHAGGTPRTRQQPKEVQQIEGVKAEHKDVWNSKIPDRDEQLQSQKI